MISLLCPTRGRPDNIRRLLASAADHAAGPVEVVLYVDDDDRTRGELGTVVDRSGVPATVVTGPRIVLSECWNRCYESANGDVLMHCGDDIVFRTPGWDKQVMHAFEQIPDRIALVHGHDLVRDPAELATHGFLHRAWVDAVGYFVPPYFSCDFNDTWLTEVADKIGRRVTLPDLITEHMHPVAGKATWDRTHRERLARGQRDGVGELYARLAPERDRDADRLRAAIARGQK